MSVLTIITSSAIAPEEADALLALLFAAIFSKLSGSPFALPGIIPARCGCKPRCPWHLYVVHVVAAVSLETRKSELSSDRRFCKILIFKFSWVVSITLYRFLMTLTSLRNSKVQLVFSCCGCHILSGKWCQAQINSPTKHSFQISRLVLPPSWAFCTTIST